MGARYKLCLSEAEREALIVLRDKGSACLSSRACCCAAKDSGGFFSTTSCAVRVIGGASSGHGSCVVSAL